MLLSLRDSQQARWCFLRSRPPRAPSRLCENLRDGPGEDLSTDDLDGLVQAVVVIHRDRPDGVRVGPGAQLTVPSSDLFRLVTQPGPRERVSLPFTDRKPTGMLH
jgi:hypothetical protein